MGCGQLPQVQPAARLPQQMNRKPQDCEDATALAAVAYAPAVCLLPQEPKETMSMSAHAVCMGDLLYGWRMPLFSAAVEGLHYTASDCPAASQTEPTMEDDQVRTSLPASSV